MYDLGAGVAPDEINTFNSRLFERMLPSFLSIGAGLVVFGMVLDAFDGLVARMTRSTTDFGGQLDSLADVVTCGVAPATLMVALMMQELKGDSIVPSPISAHPWGRVAWVCAALYVAFAAIRLARYNVEHSRDDFDYHTFRGLPSPGAAALMCACILLHDQVANVDIQRLITYLMPVAAVGTGCLMVSRIPYRRAQSYLRGKRPFSHIVILMLLFAVFVSFKSETLFGLVVCYVLSGPVMSGVRRLRLRHNPTAVPAELPVSSNGKSLK